MKTIYALGQHPKLGEVPKYMHAQVIRESRFGQPINAFQREKILVPKIWSQEVLVYIMAAGINYNNVWAALWYPLNVIKNRQRKFNESEDFHIWWSDASWVIWSIWKDVKGLSIGDEVTIHCWAKRDLAVSEGKYIWGYESNYGSFAQYAKVHQTQCLPKPKHLTWEESAVYMLSGATAYHMLYGWTWNTVQTWDPVLIWWWSWWLWSMAIQLVKNAGGLPIAVVSDDSKSDYCKALWAIGVINRTNFHHWGILPNPKDEKRYLIWLNEVRHFNETFWNILWEKKNPKIIIEHPWEDTLPTSCYLVDKEGMVAICAGTTWYLGSLDLRYLWVYEKRLQGSHFANDFECANLNDMVLYGKINPCLSKVFSFDQTWFAHQLMYENKHPAWNMAISINS